MRITLMHDGGPVSGISTYFYNILRNLKFHNEDATLYQYILWKSQINPSDGIVVVNKPRDIPHSIFIQKVRTVTDLYFGRNWHQFRQIKTGDFTILSNPALLKLTKHIHNCGVIAHDLYYLYNNNDSKLFNIYFRKQYKMFNQSDFILSNSEFTRNDMIDKLNIDPHKITTVYPYINNKIFYPGESKFRANLGLNNSKKLILSVAGEKPNKNIETVIKLMSKLPDNYILIRVGRNTSSLKLIHDLHLEKRVIFKENIGEEELADIYRGSDMFVFPSLFEGFGLPVVEAMSSGVPVLGSNSGSLPEVIENSGIVSDPYDIDFMADRIQSIVDNDKEYNKYRQLGIERAKLFNMESQYKQIISALNK